jgi:hypothetical protein
MNLAYEVMLDNPGGTGMLMLSRDGGQMCEKLALRKGRVHIAKRRKIQLQEKRRLRP